MWRLFFLVFHFKFSPRLCSLAEDTKKWPFCPFWLGCESKEKNVSKNWEFYKRKYHLLISSNSLFIGSSTFPWYFTGEIPASIYKSHFRKTNAWRISPLEGSKFNKPLYCESKRKIFRKRKRNFLLQFHFHHLTWLKKFPIEFFFGREIKKELNETTKINGKISKLFLCNFLNFNG